MSRRYQHERTSRQTQNARLLKMLRHASRGLTAADVAGSPPDQGPPILRFSARVFDLRRAGHTIVSDGQRDGCSIFKLVETAAPAQTDTSPDGPFEHSLGRVCSSPFDPFAEWS